MSTPLPPAPADLPVEFGGFRRRTESAVANVSGLAVAICGGGMLISAAVDLTDGGHDSLPLMAVGVASLAVGISLHKTFPMPARVPPRTALRTVAVGLLAMIAASAAVYWATGAIPRVDDALVESTAGFTTTALTVLPNPEDLGNGVLFWRALTQWIGGFTALATVVAVLPFLGVSGPAPTEAKVPTGARHLFSAHVRRLMRQYLVLYVILTALGACLYLVAGLGTFDAITYAFTTISTGGFANHADSFSHFHSALLEWAGVAGMFLGGLSLALAWCVLRGRHRVLWRSTELGAYVALIVSATGVIAVVEAPGDGVWESLRLSAFTATSAVSSTGHWAVDWSLWSPGPQLLLLILVGLGAMSGSMGGGFRIVRALALLSYLWREIMVQLRPRTVRVVRVGREVIDDAVVSRILGYQVLYLGTAAAGMVALTLTGADVVTAISGSVSALATFGPALGGLDVGTALAGVDHDALLVMTFLMFAGRVELYPVLDGVVAMASWPARKLRALVMDPRADRADRLTGFGDAEKGRST